MKLNATLLILVASLVLLVPACLAEDEQNQTVNASEVVDAVADVVEVVPDMTADMNSTALNMTVNQTALIALEETASAGYEWNVTLSEGLELVSEEHKDAGNETETLDGASSVHEWIVRAIEAGNQTFSGVYEQAGENTTAENATTYLLGILVE